ncbi:MAG: 1,5-anhydro-D-fructose reductase [Chloroflexi bacterium ADurb.Bin120]|jgi:predicted dehydrogenase|uniref:Putative oxidoreductase n=1 Tax=Candidatus Brevifilum fermentans TaxID=1986204 RepID=A0A1Y6K1A2_9CHLR|nr:bi-domain-containing oxidoreductase [Brevefilum fermentans]MDI9565346.1 bi-domain-containing oxidoreductase [Chloroflexota bacterium]OQB87995.1 MAG: 1,5-anhydro-D-fructose reductase [Chloroflexi bacterium ADurb.Bin120]SMX53433.1 putative oxidoreductase [Brevefilum fermentans]
MKQLLQNMKTGQAVVAEVPVPTPGDGMALIRTANSLVSAGTERMLVSFAKQGLLGKARSRPDLIREVLNKARREGLLTTIEAALNKLDQPFALGYSSAGTIIKTGSGLAGFKAGDRVACAGGGYAVHAEYAIIPQNLMVPIPEPVSFEEAAFATIGAIAMQGFRLAEVGVGARVGIIGLGLLGLLTTGIARAAGCQVLGVELDPARAELALQVGANKAVNREQAIEAARSFSQGDGLDAILICADTSDNDPLILAGEIARDRAKVVVVGSVGMEVPRKPYYEKELELVVSRSYGPGRYDPSYEEKAHDYPIGYVRWTETRNIAAFLTLLAEDKLDISSLISHRVAIEEGARAYEIITGDQPYLGVLLTYEEQDLPHERRILNTAAPSVRIRPDEILALGVLGAGNYALSTFLPVVKRIGGIAPVGIVSASGVSAHYAARRFGFGFAASEAETLLDDPVINMIAILTRHHLHSQQIQAAIQAGKHVYCEKPLAVNTEELKQIEQMLQGENRPLLTVGFNRRFAPLAQHLKAFVDTRHEPLYMHYRLNANVLPKGHWLLDPEVGGGRIIGEACHFIDFLTFLVGESPVEVLTQGLPDGGVYSEDNVIMTFRFPDQSLGLVSYLANGDKSFPKEYLEVFFGGQVATLHDWRLLATVAKGRRKMKRHLLRQDKGHSNAWRAFLAAVQGQGELPIPYEQLLGVTRASFAALESLRSGKRVEI